MRTAEEIVRAEVGHCVSALVSTLANGCHEVPRKSGHPDRDAARGALWELCEQAGELTYPIADYEEAARENGWDEDDHEIFRTVDGEREYADDWQDACSASDCDPYDREVFEHWIVSPWLGRKLEAKGEKVDFDFTGLTIWARTTTGQAIAIDGVIEEIAADLAREHPE